MGLVCGKGGATTCLKEAAENKCDVYITGECKLYTIQSLALKLNENNKELEIVRLDEEQYEANLK